MKSIINQLSILIFLIIPTIINCQTTDLLSEYEYVCVRDLISFLSQDSQFPYSYGANGRKSICESTYSATEKITCNGETVIEVFVSQIATYTPDITPSAFSCFTNLTKITLNNLRMGSDFLAGDTNFNSPGTSVRLVNPIGFIAPPQVGMVSCKNLETIVIDLHELQTRNMYFESFYLATNLEVNCIDPSISSSITWNTPTGTSSLLKKISICSSNVPVMQPGFSVIDFTVKLYDNAFINTFTQEVYESYNFVPKFNFIAPITDTLSPFVFIPSTPVSIEYLKIEVGFLQVFNLLDFQTNYPSLKTLDITTSRDFQIQGQNFQISKVSTTLGTFKLTGSWFIELSDALNILKSVVNINLSDNKIEEPLPTINPMLTNVRDLDLSSNLINGEITNSYCTIQNLNVKSNSLVGPLPSCFMCYGKDNVVFQDRFSLNGFDNTFAADWNTYQCNSIVPSLRVQGDRLYLEGTDLGFDSSTITTSPPVQWNLEIASTRFSSDYTANTGTSILYVITFTIPNRTFKLRSVPQTPEILTISITKIDQSSPYSVEFVGSDFTYDISKASISISIGGISTSCLVTSSVFSSLKCNFALTDNNQLQVGLYETSLIVNGFKQRLYFNYPTGNPYTYSYEYNECPGNCGINGICNGLTQTCSCDPGYSGPQCNIIECFVPDCNGFGTCSQTVGECICDSTHQGEYCELPFVQCSIGLNNTICSGQPCNSQIGECDCDDSYQGHTCELPYVPCQFSNRLLCGGFGTCFNQTGVCDCDDSHQGIACALPFAKCPSINNKECSGFGTCFNQTGVCTCAGYAIFDDCSGIACKSECNNGGICSNSIGQCICPANYKDDTCSTPVHYISSVDPCPSSGGQVVIYGWFSDVHTGLTVKIGSLECSNPIATSAKITCQLEAGTGSKDVSVTQNGSSFNGKNKFQYINVDNNKCPKDCSNQGKCDLSNGQCTCNQGWTGFDCASPKSVPSNNNKDVVIPESVPMINIETGKASIVNQDTNYDILILSLLELDVSNNMVTEYDLRVKFESVVDQVNGIYTFNYQIPNTTCNVSYTIKEIKQDTQYEFAGMKLSIEQGGLKISVTISNYSYKSALNTLQLRFLSSAGTITTAPTEELDNKCNELESTADTSSIDPNQTLNYISISKNSKILSGRFINRVISDDRSTFMSSEVITSLSNSSTIVVGLNLPHCLSKCELDPDFSVLVSPDFKSSCSNSDSSRKWLIPVAIVVPVVGVSALALLSVVIYKKYRYDIRLFTMKKTDSLRKLRTFK